MFQFSRFSTAHDRDEQRHPGIYTDYVRYTYREICSNQQPATVQWVLAVALKINIDFMRERITAWMDASRPIVYRRRPTACNKLMETCLSAFKEE